MTILVTGARGQVGRRVLSRLQADGEEKVRASSRDASTLTVPEGVEAVSLDLTRPASFERAFDGVDKVFLYAEAEGSAELVRAAERAGVTHLVLLSSSTVLGPDPEADPLALHHLTVERAVGDSSLDSTILRPGAFDSNSFGWGEAIRRGLVVELAYPDARVAPIHEADIADVAVAALTGDTLIGKALTLTGPETLSFREQLGIIGELLGRDIPVRELGREEAAERFAGHVPAPILRSLLDQWEAAVDDPVLPSGVTEQITGRPGRTFRQWVTEELGAFAAATD
ncbi:SDR family oxidoreductase [Kitasatospora sp. NPDC101183]|uniref:SDR family oxidoreductase n=1 Tax=Kitasatospora sp. NPDC101183 TaxID=3364100 RepID=UPI00382EC69F